MNILFNRFANSITHSSTMNSVHYTQQRCCHIIEGLRQKYLKEMAKPKPPSTHPLDGKMQAKGIIIKNLIKKPRKPNSANRKCVLVRLSTGKEKIAFVPGEGHNLQDHQVVLVEPKRLKDVPGVKLTCIRGKFDLPHIKNKD